jgi:hypothetical protein
MSALAAAMTLIRNVVGQIAFALAARPALKGYLTFEDWSAGEMTLKPLTGRPLSLQYSP